MMEFRDAVRAIIDVLGSASLGRYRVQGYEPEPEDAGKFVGSDRTVRVFYSGGKFPENSGSAGGAQLHDFSVNVEMVVAADSEMDVGALMDPESSEARRAQAIAGTRPAAMLVNEGFDELIDIIWNLLSSAENVFLGSEDYRFEHHVKAVHKDRLIPLGEHAILTGYMTVDMSVVETPEGGDIPVTNDGDTLSLTEGA